jgi:hypothetical protein
MQELGNSRTNKHGSHSLSEEENTSIEPLQLNYGEITEHHSRKKLLGYFLNDDSIDSLKGKSLITDEAIDFFIQMFSEHMS